jgi:hypothetical protein
MKQNPLNCMQTHFIMLFYERTKNTFPLDHSVYTYLRNAISLWHQCFLCGDYFVFLHLLQDADTPFQSSTTNTLSFLEDLNCSLIYHKRTFHCHQFSTPHPITTQTTGHNTLAQEPVCILARCQNLIDRLTQRHLRSTREVMARNQ